MTNLFIHCNEMSKFYNENMSKDTSVFNAGKAFID